MFSIDECTSAAYFLHFGNDLQGKRGFAGGFRAVYFNDATTRQPAHAQRDIKPQRTSGNDLDVVFDLVIAIAHDRPFTELLFNLR